MEVAEGGYDYIYANPPPDRLICKICHLPCREAQLSECCGHVFCKRDLEKMRASAAVTYACPICRVEPFNTYPNRAVDREIRELHIHCVNAKDGCTWTGELARVNEHLTKCEITCSNCQQSIHYTAMTSHITTKCPCYCQYCNTTADEGVISGHHKEKCHNYPLPCPNKCGQDSIPRCDMDKHKKVCLLEMVECLQCGIEVARKDEENHKEKNEFKHFQLTCDQKLHEMVKSNTTELNEAREKIIYITQKIDDSFNSIVHFKGEAERYLEMHDKKLDDLSNAIANNITEMRRDLKCPYKTANDDSPLGISLTVNNVMVALCVILFLVISSLGCIQVQITKIDSRLVELNDLINMVMVDASKYDICSQDHLSQTKFVMQKVENDFKTFHCVKIEEATEDTTQTMSLQTKVVSLYLKYDEPRVAPVILKLPNLTEKIKNKKHWYSDPFLAFDGGYQMCLNVHSTVYESYLSIYVFLMMGPHDDQLDQSGYFPMEGGVTIEILKHSGDVYDYGTVTLHQTKCKECTNRVLDGKMARGFGFPQFISIDSIFKHDIHNDTLFLRVSYGSISYWRTYVILAVITFLVNIVIIVFFTLCRCCCFCFCCKKCKIGVRVFPALIILDILVYTGVSLDLSLAGILVWAVMTIAVIYVMYVCKEDIPRVRMIAGVVIGCVIIRVLLTNVFFVKPRLLQ